MVEQTPQDREGTGQHSTPDERGAGGSLEDGGEGVLGVATPVTVEAGEAGTPPEREGIDTEAAHRAPEEGDMAEDPLPETENGAEVLQQGDVKRGQRRVITSKECGRALGLAKGDFNIAAKILGVTSTSLRLRCGKNQQLRALYLRKDVEPPGKDDVLTRTLTVDVPDGSKLGEALMRQNRDLLRHGLQKAGLSAVTVEKLKVFEDFAPNAAEFLVASLDLSHRMMIYQNAALFERAEDIKKNYLEDATLDDEIKIQWQQAYNEICDIIGKGYDRTLAGTQAMARMMGEGNGKEKKRKAGFTPLEDKAGG